jgi:hypothetical protein
MSEANDLALAFDGARLADSLPYIVAEYVKQEEAAITRMDRLLQDQKLTPEVAQMGWIELIQARRMRRRLEQKVRIGISAGTRQQQVLDGTAEPPLP